MTRIVLLSATACLAMAAVGVSISGCRPDSASSVSATSASDPVAQPTPEQRFQRIVETFRRAVDTNASGVASGFVDSNAGGHSSLSVRNEVTDELISPTKPGEPYRGTITVVSQYSYSMRRPMTDSGNGKSDDDKQSANSSDQQSGGDVDILDADLLAAAKKSDDSSPVQSDEMVARRTGQDERTYELVYENNRWVLKTELDPQTEQSIQFAFEHALATQ